MSIVDRVCVAVVLFFLYTMSFASIIQTLTRRPFEGPVGLLAIIVAIIVAIIFSKYHKPWRLAFRIFISFLVLLLNFAFLIWLEPNLEHGGYDLRKIWTIEVVWTFALALAMWRLIFPSLKQGVLDRIDVENEELVRSLYGNKNVVDGVARKLNCNAANSFDEFREQVRSLQQKSQ